MKRAVAVVIAAAAIVASLYWLTRQTGGMG